MFSGGFREGCFGLFGFVCLALDSLEEGRKEGRVVMRAYYGCMSRWNGCGVSVCACR